MHNTDYSIIELVKRCYDEDVLSKKLLLYSTFLKEYSVPVVSIAGDVILIPIKNVDKELFIECKEKIEKEIGESIKDSINNN